MSPRPPRPSLPDHLSATAAAYQASDVIPHCPTCASPCCKLDKLVLEMEWRQVKTLWKLDEARKNFDRRLAAGEGPQEIRAANGLYYIHSKPCPAYDLDQGSCRVYGQDTKPHGCSDFPVYEDDGCVIADLRCEAVDLEALKSRLQEALGADCRIRSEADPDFPFLVTLFVRQGSGRRCPRR